MMTFGEVVNELRSYDKEKEWFEFNRDMVKMDLCCLCLRRKTLLPESRISRRLQQCILRNMTDLRRVLKWQLQI